MVCVIVTLRCVLRAVHRRIACSLPRSQALPGITDQAYHLFHRCCTDTTLERLAQLSRRVNRVVVIERSVRRLPSRIPEKSLTFLNVLLPPTTSSAVERANGRHHEMQTSIYLGRADEHVCQRVAEDMLCNACVDDLPKLQGRCSAAGRSDSSCAMKKARPQDSRSAMVLQAHHIAATVRTSVPKTEWED